MFPSNSLRHTRASSIPRQYYRDRTIQEERFSLSDAVHLKLRIQNLDNALAHAQQDIDVEKIEQASQSRPFHETTSPYVNGSEEFFLVVKSISRPDLIPEVYLKAYRAVLDQRPYTNEYRISDFRKGVDPIFSDIRALLPRIDAVCDTDLAGVFSNLEAKGKMCLQLSCTVVNVLQSNLFHSFNYQLNSVFMFILKFFLGRIAYPL